MKNIIKIVLLVIFAFAPNLTCKLTLREWFNKKLSKKQQPEQASQKKNGDEHCEMEGQLKEISKEKLCR